MRTIIKEWSAEQLAAYTKATANVCELFSYKYRLGDDTIM